MNYKNIRKVRVGAPLCAVGLIVLGAAFPVASASADSASGGYIGFGWGRFDQKSDLALASSENNNATKFLVGYQLNRFIGVESGFANFNNLTFDLGDGSTARLENDSYYARLNLQLPLFRSFENSVALYAGGGAHQWDAREVTADAGGSITGEGRARDTGIVYGAGVLVRGQRDAALRFDYEVFKDVGTANKIDLNLLSVNLLVYF